VTIELDRLMTNILIRPTKNYNNETNSSQIGHY